MPLSVHAMMNVGPEREVPLHQADQHVAQIEQESAREFRDILFQLVLQRTGEAIETIARTHDLDVRSHEQSPAVAKEIHDCMVDIEVARNAAKVLRGMNEGT